MQSVLRILGRLLLLAVVLFLSLLLVVLDGSAGSAQDPNWAVPLLLVVWGAAAYLAHLRGRWARRRPVAGRPRSGRGLRRGDVVNGSAVALAGAAAGVVAFTLAGAPVVPLASSVVLGAVVGVVASDILRRLGWSE